MDKTIHIGVLAFQGNVSEHICALMAAAEKKGILYEVVAVRTKEDLSNLDALVIPGGESTVLQKLCEREEMFEGIRKIKCIMGTCAGAIMLAKIVHHKEEDQRTLELMDITIDRNAYGRQKESFEKDITSAVGKMHGVFIRAPKIEAVEKQITILAKDGNEILACEEEINDKYYLAICFHPELTNTLFHEYFLEKISRGL